MFLYQGSVYSSKRSGLPQTVSNDSLSMGSSRNSPSHPPNPTAKIEIAARFNMYFLIFIIVLLIQILKTDVSTDSVGALDGISSHRFRIHVFQIRPCKEVSPLQGDTQRRNF